MAGIANVWLRMNLRLSAFLMRKGGIPFARAAQDKLGRLGARAVGARVEFVPHAFREFQAAWILPQGYDPEGGAILYLHGGGYRCRKGFVWGEEPAEGKWVYAEQQACFAEVRRFHDLSMVAAVNEVEGIAFALMFVRAAALEHHERVGAGGACALFGIVHIHAGGKRLVLPLPFVRPCAGERDEIKRGIRQVELCAHRAHKRNRLRSQVFVFRMAGDHIAFVKRGIKQAHAQARGRILQRETVRLAVPAVAIRRRKPCNVRSR